MQFNKFSINDFLFQDQKIILNEKGKQKISRPKKITGSRIGAILGVDPYTTPFQAWCQMMGFFESTPDPFFLNAGIIIEPKLRSFVEKKLNCKFRFYEGKDVGFDVFKSNPVFGGMPDGEPIDQKTNKINYHQKLPMLEIKTTSLDEYFWTTVENELALVYENDLPKIKSVGTRFSKWVDDKHIKIPLNYLYQLGLYLYLRNQTKGLFCVAFLSTQDYLNPESFNLEKSLVLLEELEIDLKSFQKVIDYAINWYQQHILSGISPKMTNTDLEWFSFGYPDIKKK
ncbi:YqaJ viral recombinase family protein [[Mycoplasma] cavipharyngis]|uniref:MPN551 family DNA-binding protein n=1 Tax=[Mycoplasma] cavipharyngis TaxID=92757 RepID=UPI0037047B5E